MLTFQPIQQSTNATLAKGFKMKTVTRSQLSRPCYFVCAALLAFLTAGLHARAEEPVVKEMQIEGRVVKDVRVSDVTPTHVTVSWEGNVRKFDRQNLPPELQSRYPYDAKAAADFKRKQEAAREQQTSEQRVRQDQRNREVKASLLRQESETKGRLQKLQNELIQLEKEMAPMKGKAQGKKNSVARKELDAARDRKQDYIHRIGEQDKLLANIRKQLDALP
jgi:hypothetical protein